MSEQEQQAPVNLTDNNGTNGRNSKGQFTNGNTYGQGNRGTGYFRQLIKSELNEPAPNSNDTKAQVIVRGLIDKAINGDIRAVQILINYTDGLPARSIDKETEDANLSFIERIAKAFEEEEKTKQECQVGKTD